MKRALAGVLGLLATVSCSQGPDVVTGEALSRAERYESQGKLDEAIIEWRRALAVDPALVAARHALGRAYGAKLWYRDAAAELLAAQEIAPQSAVIGADLGRVLIELRAWKRARAQAERILQSEPSNPEALVIRAAASLGEGNVEEVLASPATPTALRAEALLRSGRLAQAERAYRTLLAEHSADVGVLAGLGEVNLLRRRYREAAAYFERADALRSGDPNVRVRLAAALVRLGRLSDAIRTLEEIHPRARSGGTLIALGWCYLRAGRAREATELLAPLVEQAPGWAELRFLLGTGHLASGRPAAAVFELERADEQAPGNPLVRLRLAAAYTRVGRARDALDMLDTLGKAGQDQPGYHLERGWALLRAGRLDEAHAAAESARRLIPQAPQPYTLLGAIEAQRAEPGRAAAALVKALELDPAYAPAHLALGRLREAQGDVDGALQAFDAASRLDPISVAAIRAKTIGLIGQERVEDALHLVEAALKADPRNADLHALLGRAHLEDRDPGRAQAALRRALELDTRSVMARLGLAELAVKDQHPMEAIRHLRAALKDRPSEPTVVRRLVALYRTDGQYDRAIGVLEAALEADPGQSMLARQLGDLYVVTGRYRDAITRMSDLLSRHPDLAAALLTRSQAYAATGRSEEAIRDLGEALRSTPGSPMLHYHLARAYAGRGRAPEAQAAYRKAIELDPEFETARIELALLSEQPLDEASWRRRIDQLQGALRAEPRSVEVREALARTLLAKGDVGAAQRELQAILERVPGHANANHLVARVLSGQGKREEAIGHLEIALRTNPSHAAAQMLMARQLLAGGRREQAVLHLEAALRIDPSRGDAMLELVRLYTEDGRLVQALHLAHQLRRHEPANPGGPLGVGTVLLADRRPADAIVAFKAAIKMRPDLVDAHRGLGRAQQASGQRDGAAASYERALALDGNDVGSLTSLAVILSETRGESERALALATRAAALRPTASDVLDALGWIHYRRGAYAEAVRVLGRAVEGAPDRGVIRYHLGMAYVALGQTRQAVSTLRHAARLDADLARSERLDDVIAGLGG